MSSRPAYDIEHWIKRAEEARSLAEGMHDADAKLLMLGIAESYEQIAKSCAKVAQWAERTSGPESPPEAVC